MPSLMFVYNTLQQAIEAVIGNSHAHQELLRRSDAGTALVKLYERYEILTPDDFPDDWSAYERGSYISELMQLEVLLAQEPVLSTLDREQKVLLVRMIVSKYNAAKTKQDVIGPTGLPSPMFLAGRILVAENYEPLLVVYSSNADVRGFLTEGYVMMSREVLETIELHARNYTKTEEKEEGQ